MPTDGLWRRAPGVLLRRTPVSLVLDAPGPGDPLRIEGGAVAVWDALDTPGSRETVILRVAHRAGRPTEDVAADVVRTLTVLESSAVVVAP